MDTSTKPVAVGQARITRILHPTDFSPACERSYEYALLLSKLTGAELHLVHVIRVPEEMTPSKTQLTRAVADAEKRLEAVCRAVGDHAPVAHGVRLGAPHAEIIRYAKENKVDLVVMGTVGLSGDAPAVGSVAEKVIRGLTIPVLTLKAALPSRGKASGRRCAMCGEPATDVICDACKDRVRGEAVGRHRRR
jgi:nucleotide-binding universal stress UspA family protein